MTKEDDKFEEYANLYSKISKEIINNNKEFISLIDDLIQKNTINNFDIKELILRELKAIAIVNERLRKSEQESVDSLKYCKKNKSRKVIKNIYFLLNDAMKRSTRITKKRKKTADYLLKYNNSAPYKDITLNQTIINVNNIKKKYELLLQYRNKLLYNIQEFINKKKYSSPLLKSDFKWKEMERIGNAKVMIHIKLDYEMLSQEYADYHKILKIRAQNIKTLTKREQKKREQRKNINPRELCEFLHFTITEILIRNPQIIKTSKVNLYVELLTHIEENFVGQYLSSRSNYSNIFIKVLLTEDFLVDYFSGKRLLTTRKQMYDTIIHELIHAEDPLLVERSKEDLSEIKVIIKEAPMPETIAFVNLMESLRTEGLARFGSKLRVEKKIPAGYVFKIHEASEMLNEFIKNNISSGSANKIIQEVNKIYSSGKIHDLGQYMCLVIFVHKFNHKLSYVAETLKISENTSDNNENNKEEIIPYSEIHNYLGVNNTLKIITTYITDNEINNFFTLIKNTNAVKFIQMFERGCYELKLEQKPVSLDMFMKINERAKDQFEAYLKQEGF